MREAFNRQPISMSQFGRERHALDECKPHEDAYVAALMAARPVDMHRPVLAWGTTWVACVVDPLTVWIASPGR